jgi:uncharacterized SAM-binding protein YcdF (DUF218 family)
MYYVLSKTVGFFAIPTNLIACLAFAGLVLLILRHRLGLRLCIAALVAFVIAALSPIGNMLITPLEQRFPAMTFPDGPIEGIIVLGGSYDTYVRGGFGLLVLNEDTEPLAIMARLAQRYPQAKVVFSGGSPEPGPENDDWPSEAAAAKRLFLSFGIAEDRIELEIRSRNTVENARFSAELLRPRPGSRWLIVTAAHHIPRAVGAFRAAGFDAIGFPAGWRTHGWRDLLKPSPSATENLRRIDVAAREWAGLIAYRALGYSHSWFPAP